MSVVDDLDRTSRLHREQRCVARDDVWKLLLAAESAAGGGLDDSDLFWIARKEWEQSLVDVVRTLKRSDDREGTVFFLPRGDAVILDVRLLLERQAVLSLDDHIGGSETTFEISFRDLETFEHIVIAPDE